MNELISRRPTTDLKSTRRPAPAFALVRIGLELVFVYVRRPQVDDVDIVGAVGPRCLWVSGPVRPSSRHFLHCSRVSSFSFLVSANDRRLVFCFEALPLAVTFDDVFRFFFSLPCAVSRGGHGQAGTAPWGRVGRRRGALVVLARREPVPDRRRSALGACTCEGEREGE
jgi:hypothetical protein